jgi:HK97 family phage prohead protease
MKTKTFRAAMQVKADGAPGEFRAVFSTFNVIDHDGDVTLPGAFKENQAVRISYWGHRWQDLPVGRGTIHQDEKQAWVDGKFFMDTVAGKETYQTVKNLGELQEWSYGYDVLLSEQGKFGDPQQDVRFLKELDVTEVSPVMLGAGVDTRTEAIKGVKPYPNEHACRLRQPGDFQADSFKRIKRKHEGKEYSIIVGKLKDDNALTEQAYRYDDEVWTAAEARSHCKTHEGSFEAATGKSDDDHGQDLPSPDGEGNTPRSQLRQAQLSSVQVVASRIEIEQMEE